MAKPRYNSVDDYVEALLSATMSPLSMSQLKQYYKRKGDTNRTDMITEAMKIVREERRKEKKGDFLSMEYLMSSDK